MVSVVDVVGLLVIVGANSALAAVLTRFFRVRLDSAWAPVLFTGLFTPVVLLVVAQVLGGVAGLGFDLGSAAAVVAVVILLPLAMGLAFDYFWMPAPEEVDLPAEYRESDADAETTSRTGRGRQ